MSFLGSIGKILGDIVNPANLLEDVVGGVLGGIGGPIGDIAGGLFKDILSPIVGNLSMFPTQLVKGLPGILQGASGLIDSIGGLFGKIFGSGMPGGGFGIAPINPFPAPISTPPSTGFGSIMNNAMDKVSGMYDKVQNLMNNLPDDPVKAQQQMMKAQMMMQSIQQIMTMLTNMMKTMHNINMSIIQNMKG